jgi:hypothetical protein
MGTKFDGFTAEMVEEMVNRPQGESQVRGGAKRLYRTGSDIADWRE